MVAPRQGEDQMAGSNAHGAPVTRAELREELDRFREEVRREFRQLAAKADFESLKTWIVCTGLVAVVNLVGTGGAIVAVFTR